MLGNALKMPIALRGSALRRLTQDRRCSWRDDHVSIRMARGDSAVDAGLILGSIADERGEWSCDLVEQEPNLRAIIDIAAGQLGCEDLPGGGIQSDVQLSPGPAPPGAVFLDQPLTRSTQAQAYAVDQQVNRVSGAWRWLWDLQPFGAAAQRRVIGHGQIQTQELEN
jgi:hypothetical protein